MQSRSFLVPAAALCWVIGASVESDALADQKPAMMLGKDAVAFLQKHCVACHGEKVKRADLTLHTFTDDLAILKGRKTFDNVLKMVTTGEMPPKAKPRPTPAEIDGFVKSVNAVFAHA